MGNLTKEEAKKLLTKENAEKLIEKANEKQSKENVNRKEYKDMDPDREYLKKKQGADFKPAGAVLGILAMGAAGAIGAKKLMKKKSSVAPIGGAGAALAKKPIEDLYQKKTEEKTAKMSMGGEIEIGKGKDYIKDLID